MTHAHEKRMREAWQLARQPGKKRWKHPATRVVLAHYHLAPEDQDTPTAGTELEKVLLRYQALCVLAQFDVGRGRDPWFEGKPGAAFRQCRREVEALLGPRFRSGWGSEEISLSQLMPFWTHR